MQKSMRKNSPQNIQTLFKTAGNSGVCLTKLQEKKMVMLWNQANFLTTTKKVVDKSIFDGN